MIRLGSISLLLAASLSAGCSSHYYEQGDRRISPQRNPIDGSTIDTMTGRPLPQPRDRIRPDPDGTRPPADVNGSIVIPLN